jgi:endoglucanase
VIQVLAGTMASVLVMAAGVAAAPVARAAAGVDAMATVAAMQPGWNLGNTLDATPEETSWGNPLATKEQFAAVRAAGFRSVRIPVTWNDHQGPGPDYAIDPVRMNRVKEVVDLALANDLYVLLNVHHDSWLWMRDMPTNHDGVMARYRSTWTQIATAFRDAPARVTFESVNEPQFTDTTEVQADQLIDEVNRAFHEVVRTSGGNNATRLLVLPPTSGLESLATTITSLDDPYVAATLHYYGWWPFSVNIAGKTTFDADTKQDMVNQFARMYDTFVAKGIPVIIGEYGLLSYDLWTHPGTLEDGEVKKFFEEFGYQARTKNMTTMVWDAGSFLNRATLQWRDPEMIAQILSSTTTRSGTASSDMVFLPTSGTITSRTLTLNLNGTTFTGLRYEGTDLVDGTDYTVSGDQLTVTAAALTRLAGDRAYGVNATLSARFSQGVPWRIDVITSDTPVLSDATGTTGSFTIPTDFRGDRLATLEARYDDGSNAGPANWTSYQEFGRCLARDYAAGTISVLTDFFDTISDSSRVTLTFHFWSGATVTYHVTKTGTSVTGAAVVQS